MNQIEKIKTLYIDNKPSGHSFFEKIVNPKMVWNVLIILFVISVLSSIGFDFYTYKNIVSGDMYVSVSRNDLVIENLKSSDLKNILNTFETKKTNIASLKLVKLVDPSI